MKNRRAFVKRSTTDFSTQSHRQWGSDTLISSGSSRWRACYAEWAVSTRSKVDDTQFRNGSVITGLCLCKFLHPPGTHFVVAHSRLYSALHLPTMPHRARRSLYHVSRFIYLLIFFQWHNFTALVLLRWLADFAHFILWLFRRCAHTRVALSSKWKLTYLFTIALSIYLRKLSLHDFTRHFLNSFNIDCNDFTI